MRESESELAESRIEQKKLVMTLDELCDASMKTAHQANVKMEEMQQVGLERDELLRALEELRTTHEAFCSSRAHEHDKMVVEVRTLCRFLLVCRDAVSTDYATAEYHH